MANTFKQIAALPLIALIAFANPTHAFTHLAGLDTDLADDAARAADQSSQTDDQSADDQDHGVDLGDQPVLLMHQSYKPIPQTTADPTDIQSSVLAEVYAKIPRSLPVESRPIDTQVVICPNRYAGVSLMPHGPPINIA